MLSKVTDYLKNVGKSVVYATSDVLEKDNEFIYNFANTNKEVFTAAYSSVRNYRTTINKIETNFKQSKVYQAADIGIKALFEDLKTGKFYNKARAEEIAATMGGFDMSDDFDIEEFEKGLANRDIAEGDKAVIEAVEKSTRLSGELVSDTVARSASAVISNQKASDRIFFTQNVQMISGIKAVAETTSLVGKTINNTNQMLKTMADNQKTYYERTGRAVDEMHAMMREFLDMQRNLYNAQRKAEQNASGKKKQNYSDIIDYRGVLNLQEYAKNVKSNINRKISDSPAGMLFNGGFGEDANMLAQFVSSPLEFIPKWFVRHLIPEATKNASKSLNDTLSGLVSTTIAKLNNMAEKDDSPFAKLFGEIFGVKIRKKTKVEVGKYNKGPVPFDGITRKAIVDVIPGYLRRIEAIISGNKERVFDYSSGKWTGMENATKKLDTMYMDHIKSTMNEFVGEIEATLKNVRGATREEDERLTRARNAIYKDIYEHNGDWTRYTKKGRDYTSQLAREISSGDTTVDANDIKMIAKAIKEIQRKNNGDDWKKIAVKLSNQALSGRETYTRRMDELEKNMDSSAFMTALEDIFSNAHINSKTGMPLYISPDKNKKATEQAFQNTLGAAILKVKDEYKHDIFYYLRSLEDNATWVREYLSTNRIGGGGGNSGNSNVPDFNAITALRGNATNLDPDALYREAQRKLDEYYARARRSDFDSGRVFAYSQYGAGAYGGAATYMERTTDKAIEQARIDKANSQEENLFWSIFHDTSKAKKDYDSKKFLEQLRDAHDIGEKYEVIKHGVEKLAAAPMKMLEHVIRKADESVYHFMFGRADDEVDEDGNPIQGLLAKTIHEMKATFKKLNVWLNEKLLDPLKKKLDEWGIHSVTDVLDKITGGRFSDAKNAIADTVLGTKGEDGLRTGGWADPFRKAFSYNFGEIYDRRAAEARRKKERDRARQEALAEMQAEDDFNSINHAEGTAGKAKSDLFTMLSPGEELISPSGRSRIVSESESYAPHIVPKGTTIYNPQPRSVRKRQKEIEQQKAVAWAKNMKFNASADETGGLYDFEKKIFNNEKAKAQFQEQYEYLDMYLEEKASELIASGTDEGIALGQEYLVLYEEFNRYKSNYAGIMNPDPKGYGSNYTIYAKFVKWVKNAYKALTTNSLKEAFYVEDQKAKQTKANVQNKTESEPEKIKNQWLHEQLDKLKYDEAKPENIARVNKIADTTAKTAIGAGAGLLLGNPLLGLVGGAVAGIVKNNKAINEFIFGDIEHDNGLISKKTQQYLKDAIPTVRKTSLIGGIAGLVTGLGPIPGILMGSVAGFAAKNEDLMETLFGPKEEREKRMEKIKKAAPRMGIGAAAGALLGPFGLLGGAALGAAGGLFTTTNTFKELLYGEIDEDGNPVKDEDGKLKGGILGALQVSFVDPLKEFANDMKTKAKDFIRDKIVDPIAGAIKPITAGMKHIVKDVLTAVPNALNWVFEKSFGIPMGDFLRDKVFGPIARFTKGFLKLPFTIFKGILSAPGKIIGGIGNAIRGGQIRRGTADYMTAEERLAYREQHKTQFRGNWIGKILHPFRRDRMLAEDEALARAHVGDIKNENGEVTSYGVDTIIQGIEELTTSERDAGKAVRTAQRQLNNIVDKHFRNRGLISLRNDKDKILKALNNGKLDQAMKLIEKLKTKDGKKLSGEELQNFQDDVTKAYNVLEEAKALRKSVGSRRGRDRSSGLAKYEKMLKDQGFKNVNLKSDRQRSRILALLKQEKSSKAGAYADTLSEDDKISAEATVGAINSQTADLLKALTGIKESIDLINTNYDGAKDTSKGAAGVNKIFEDLQDTDENGEPVMKTEFGKSFTRGMSNSIHKDVVNSARRRYKVNQRRHQRKRKDDNLVFERITKVKDLGINTQPNGYWSSNDDRARKIFNLLDKNSKFDVNTALKHAFNTKNFIKNFSTAMSTSNGVFVEADFINRIASIRDNKTEQECLSKAVAAGIDLTNKTIFSLDSLNALLGASEKQLKYNTIKEVFKQIKNYIKAYNVAPTPAEIQTWFANLSQLRSDAKYTKQKLKEQAEQEAEQDNSTPSANPSPVFSNADADEGTETIPVEHVSWLKDKWREKIKPGLKGFKSDIGSSFDDLKDIRNTKKTKNLKYELLVVKGIKAIIDRTTRVAEATENQDEREEEKTKEEKKLAKKKAKADKKANGGNLWQRANAKVEAFGENVKNKGDNFLRALSHPIKMVKGAIHGSKEEYESKQDGDKFSIIDILHGIKKGQEKELEILKDQEDKGERKEPIWKRVLKAIFGKSLASIAFRTFALPLGVGLFKNQVWPLIKEKAWPWIQNKLFGDPERDDDGFFGRLKYWFKDHVVPVLFGEKNEEGVWTKGWFSGAANFWEQKAKPFIFGEDGNGGVIGKIKDLIKGATYVIADTGKLVWSWFANEDFHPVSETQQLFPGIFKDQDYQFSDIDKGSTGFGRKLLTTWADGAGTMVEFATKTIIQVLPDVLLGLGKGIVSGVGAWITGKDTSGANYALQKTVNSNNYKDAVGQVTNSGSSEDGLLTYNAKYGTFNGAGGGGTTEIGTGSDLDENGNLISGSYTEYETDSYGAVSELLKSNNPIYDATTDITADLQEIDSWYQKYKNGEDPELAEALELAQKNLVILPMSVFESEDAYKAWITSVFGPEAVESIGWENLMAIDEPYLIYGDSEAYRQVINRMSRGEKFSLAMFKTLVTGGRTGRFIPALLRGGSKVLNLVAKVASKFGFTGKLISVGIKGIAKVTSVAGGLVDTSVKLSKTALGDAKAGEALLVDMAEFQAKHPKLIGFTKTVGDFFKGLFESSEFLQKIAEIGKTTMSAAKKKIAPLIEKLSTGFVKGLTSKVPNLLKSAGQGLLKALPFINAAFITTAFCNGFFDAQNVLGFNPNGGIISPNLRLISGVVAAVNEVLTAGLVPTDWIAQWFVDNVMIGIFGIEDEYTVAHEAAQRRVNEYNAAHGTNLSIREYNAVYHPSESQLMTKDLENFDIGSLASHWWTGVQDLFNGNAIKNLGLEGFYGGGTFGRAKEALDNIDSFFGQVGNTIDTIAGTAKTTKIFGSGKHVDQRMSNMRYNAPGDTEYQTVADSGCGPAAAVSVLSHYGKGKLEEAATFSLKNGYKEPNGGTYPGFFGDYLGQNGIATNYERDPNNIMGNLAQGNPVILMGTGGGANKSPFDGANGSHYVTATGLDRNGNMIIEDPDERRGGLKYNAKNVLDRTSIAIATHPGRGRKRKFGRSKLPKISRTKYGRGIFGRGYTIDQLDSDGLQDMRVWKDPGNEKDAYIKAISERIHKAASGQVSGIYYKYSNEVATAAVNAGLTTGIDPALALAIGMMESGMGSTPTAKNKLNFWGYNYNDITWEDGASDFSNGTNGDIKMLEFAFTEWMHRIADNYYAVGQNCLYKMYNNGGHHQYSGEVNDITTNWVVDVAYYMKAIHDVVGQTLDNMSYHPGNGNSSVIDDIAQYLYSTADGFTGMTGTDTTPNKTDIRSYSGDITTTGYDSTAANGSSGNQTIFSMIAEFGKNVLKKIFGPIYDLVFGSTSSSSSYSSGGNYSGSSAGYYDENGNWVNAYQGAENATSFFLKTLQEQNPNAHVSATYNDPSYVKEIGSPHRGIDFATGGVTGLKIFSPVNGVVARTGYESGGYGNFIRVDDEDGIHSHVFAHLNEIPGISAGQTVERGQQVGISGNTGYSLGPHLHYEVDDYRKEANKYNKGTLGWSVNPDTEYDWSKYLPEEVIENMGAENPLTKIPRYTGHMTDFSNLSTDELIDQYSRWLESTYKNKDKVNDYTSQVNIESLNKSYINELGKRRDLLIQEFSAASHASTDSDYYKKAKSKYDKYYYRLSNLLNYKTIQEEKKQEEIAKEEKMTEGERIAAEREEHRAAYLSGPNYVSSDKMTPLARSVLRAVHSKYSEQFSPYISDSAKDLMIYKGEAKSESAILKDLQTNMSWSKYGINWPYPGEFTANGHYSYHDGKYSAGIGYDLNNNWEDAEAAKNFINSNPLIFSNPDYWRLPDVDIMKGSLGKRNNFLREYGDKIGIIQEYMNSLSYDPFGNRYNYGKFWDWYVNRLNSHVDETINLSKQQFGEVAVNPEYYNLAGLGKRFGLGKFNGASAILRKQAEIDKIKDSRGRDAAKRDLNKLVEAYIRENKDLPAISDESKAIGGQSRNISRTLGTAKMVKKPRPVTRPTAPTNYGKAKLPTLSTTKTYINNAVTTTNANSNDIAMINYSKLIITIIELLTSINDNSNKVDKIIDLLRKYGPSFGIDTSGYGKAKTGAEKKAVARHSIVRNHVMDPSWGFAAMDNMNRNDVANKFMEEVQALARE